MNIPALIAVGVDMESAKTRNSASMLQATQARIKAEASLRTQQDLEIAIGFRPVPFQGWRHP